MPEQNSPLNAAFEDVDTSSDGQGSYADLHRMLLDANDNLNVHVRCMSCGHDLIGKHFEANCDKCGAPVAKSLSSNLGYADPRWLSSLRIGVFLLVLVGLALLTLPVIAAIATNLRDVRYLRLVERSFSVWQIATMFSIFISGWFYLKKEPGRKLKHSGRYIRLARAACIPGLLIVAANIAVFVMTVMSPAQRRSAQYLSAAALALGGVCAAVVLFGIVRRSVRLMEAMPAATLSSSKAKVRRVAGAVVVGGFAVVIAPWLLHYLASSFSDANFNSLFTVLGIVQIVVLVPWLVVALAWFFMQWGEYARQCGDALAVSRDRRSLRA